MIRCFVARDEEKQTMLSKMSNFTKTRRKHFEKHENQAKFVRNCHLNLMIYNKGLSKII